MTSHKGHLTIDQGAETPIWLAMAPDIPSGAFVYKKEVKNWLHDGKMTFWLILQISASDDKFLTISLFRPINSHEIILVLILSSR